VPWGAPSATGLPVFVGSAACGCEREKTHFAQRRLASGWLDEDMHLPQMRLVTRVVGVEYKADARTGVETARVIARPGLASETDS